jgi:membrane protein
MFSRIRKILESTVDNYIASDSITRGAAIAFYSVTSLIPVLVIVIAIAGLAFGEEAAVAPLCASSPSSLGPTVPYLSSARSKVPTTASRLVSHLLSDRSSWR